MSCLVENCQDVDERDRKASREKSLTCCQDPLLHKWWMFLVVAFHAALGQCFRSGGGPRKPPPRSFPSSHSHGPPSFGSSPTKGITVSRGGESPRRLFPWWRNLTLLGDMWRNLMLLWWRNFMLLPVCVLTLQCRVSHTDSMSSSIPFEDTRKRKRAKSKPSFVPATSGEPPIQLLYLPYGHSVSGLISKLLLKPPDLSMHLGGRLRLDQLVTSS